MKDTVLAILVSSCLSYAFATYKSRQAIDISNDNCKIISEDTYYSIAQDLSEINGRNYRLHSRVEDLENQIMILSKESAENNKQIDLALRYIKTVHKRLKEGK